MKIQRQNYLNPLKKCGIMAKNKTINILSERGMCDSCKSVAEQFIKKHP